MKHMLWLAIAYVTLFSVIPYTIIIADGANIPREIMVLHLTTLFFGMVVGYYTSKVV